MFCKVSLRYGSKNNGFGVFSSHQLLFNVSIYECSFYIHMQDFFMIVRQIKQILWQFYNKDIPIPYCSGDTLANKYTKRQSETSLI